MFYDKAGRSGAARTAIANLLITGTASVKRGDAQHIPCYYRAIIFCGKPAQKEGALEMAVVFVEARPKGASQDSPIEDYVVEDHADHVLATFRTQGDAIYWAKRHGHTPHVARVRDLNDKKTPDHWRAA